MLFEDENPSIDTDAGEDIAPIDNSATEAQVNTNSADEDNCGRDDLTEGDTDAADSDADSTETQEGEHYPCTVSDDEIGDYIPPSDVKIPPLSDDEFVDGGVKSKRVAFLNSVFDFIELFVFTLVSVLLIASFLIRPSVVDGDSMQNTLENGDVLLISDLFYTPKRGDIIVLEDYSTELKKPIVKRVIAVGGDLIRITKDRIYVNGQPLVEDYVRIDYEMFQYDTINIYPHINNPTLEFGPDYYQLEVPIGELFVMGDHRNASTDSRSIGTVDVDSVLGRVVLRVYPLQKFGKT